MSKEIDEAYLFTVIANFKVRVHKQNIFWFEISVGQFVIMKKFDRIAQLVSNMTNSFQWVGLVIIILLKYKTKNFINL